MQRSLFPPTGDCTDERIEWLSVVPIMLSVLLAVLDYAVANIALPTIAGEMGVSASHAVWVVNAYQLASTMLTLPMAAWSSRIGAARTCMMGLVVIMLGSSLCAAAHSFAVLVIARMIQGCGGACILAVAAALIRSAYPASKLGRGLALNALVTAMGVALSPSVAAIILSVASWRWLFLFNLPFGGVALVLSALFMRGAPPVIERIDWLSSLLCLIAFGSVIVGSDLLVHAIAPMGAAALIGLGAVCFVLLLRSQHGLAAPILPVDLLAIRDFRVAALVCFLGYAGANFFMISTPFTLVNHFHRSPVLTGLLITPWPVGMMVASPFVGRLADRYPAAILSSLGLFIVGMGYLLLRLAPASASNLDLMLRMGFAGIGYALFVAPNNKAMMAASPVERSGGASGMMSIARLTGQTTGATLVALLLAIFPTEPSLNCLEFGTVVVWIGALVSASRLKARPTLAVAASSHGT
ncbi:MFS transporter [Ameyamaea chiangmaiensis]|nr:MFS transporter [Ameyamaea chiangmaiensis]MBS4074704.1 MFS transporter [Ameyamaea chiangmaiensis]